MTNVIFSFDTEDFTSSYAADGIIDIAEILRSEGIRGCFCIVGLLAKQLLAWGRGDVLEALKYHEVDFHSYGHTLHPTIGEYTNINDFYEAYSEVFRKESAGLSYVKAATGAERIFAAVPPGMEKSYVAMYAYADMGIPCYADTFADTFDGRGVFFCNMLQTKYFKSLESLHDDPYAYDPKFYDMLAERKNVIIYSHPNRLRYDVFWDIVNYKGTNLYPFGQWKEAKRTDENDRLKLLKDIRHLIKTLKADGRFVFKTYEDIVAERCGGARMLTLKDIRGLRQALQKNFYPQESPVSLCIADIFAAAVNFLRGDKMFAAGRVYGFLEEPYAITAPACVCAADVRAAAAEVDLEKFLPEYFNVGGKKLGPADFLFAMLDVLCGEDPVTLAPRPQNIDLSGFPLLANPPILDWPVQSPEFKAEYLIKRLPLQAWTLRF